MTSKRFREDEFVKCPFYRKEDAITIKCDGICGEHTLNSFRNGAAKDDWKDEFCIGYYWNCRLYRAIAEDIED